MSMHPGVVLALCGLLTFWFRFVGAVHWSWFELFGDDSAGPHGGVRIVEPSFRNAWFNFDSMLSGQGMMLLLAALGSVWAWQTKPTSDRLPFWRLLCGSAAIAAIIRGSALLLGRGEGWSGWRLSDVLERVAEIVLYLGVIAVSVQRHRMNPDTSEVPMPGGDAEPHHEDSP